MVETEILNRHINRRQLGIWIEPEKESRIDSCYECCVKDGDYSEKKVFHCELCDKWFCEKHRKPKFPAFVDWDTISDVQGNPTIKLVFYNEYRRKDGHPDLIYFRRTIEAEELDEKIRTRLIAQALDRMEDAIAKRGPEEKEGRWVMMENKHGRSFEVPLEVYSSPQYREYLENAETEKSVKAIVDEYYRKYKKKKHWWQ